jgi:hypothetical protein
MEELCAWIERVTEEWSKWMLSVHGLELLEPILKAISGQDRIDVFGDRLSIKARRFLEYYREGKFIRIRFYKIFIKGNCETRAEN